MGLGGWDSGQHWPHPEPVSCLSHPPGTETASSWEAGEDSSKGQREGQVLTWTLILLSVIQEPILRSRKVRVLNSGIRKEEL